MNDKPKRPHRQAKVQDEQLKAARQWIVQKIGKVLDNAAKVLGVTGEATDERRVRAALYSYAAKFCEGMARSIKDGK